MKRIGFANKYFTLWDVQSTENYSTDPRGNHYLSSIMTRYTFYQNLSMDESKAIEKAKGFGCTDLVPDDELKGKRRSWDYTKQIKYDYQDFEFQFGRYDKQDIRECTDFDYLMWYYNSQSGFELQFVTDRIIELNPEYVMYDGRLETKETVTKIENRQSIKDETVKKIKTDGFVDVFIEYNVDSHGTININGTDYFFPETKEQYYNGHSYYIPALNGKGKRIKNKNVRLYTSHQTEINDWKVWVVSNFEILKK